MRAAVGKFMAQPWISQFILGVIVANAIILGLQTSASIEAKTGGVLKLLDNLSLAIFTVELALKLFSQGVKFFRGGWNNFDFIIIGISLMPGAGGLSVLRALRILRVLRVISIAPRLRRVVEGFITALPGMASVFLLMAIIFYIGAVMATKLFGAEFPVWFGSIGESGYSLFQIMTLESWSMGIVRPVMDVFPHAWAFFVPFIMVTTFAVVNLLVGLVVNSMQEANDVESVAATDQFRDDVMSKLDAIAARLDLIEKSNS